jgi:hypothetical protein
LAGVDGGANDLTITTGNRNDNVLLQNTFVRRDLTIDTAGTDTFGDIVDLFFVNIGDDTVVTTGGGSDLVRVADAGFNDDLTIDTGAGNDTVTINRTQVDEFFLFLGSGNDQATLTSTTGRRAALNGGGDFDTLNRSGDSRFDSFPMPVLFEAFNFF